MTFKLRFFDIGFHDEKKILLNFLTIGFKASFAFSSIFHFNLICSWDDLRFTLSTSLSNFDGDCALRAGELRSRSALVLLLENSINFY